MKPTKRKRRKDGRGAPDSKTGTIVITAISLLLACLGIAISIVGTVMEERPAAAESAER